MFYGLKKISIACACTLLAFYPALYAMSNPSKNPHASRSPMKLQCPDGDVQISPTLFHLLPVIEDLAHDLHTNEIPVIFSKNEVQTIINATAEIHAQLATLAKETHKKYSVHKKYTPDDIPLHVRRIARSHMTNSTAQGFANLMACANYMLAPYLVNALAAEWALKNFKKKDDALNSDDVMRFIKKYRDYAQEKIYYECSIADLFLTSRKHPRYTHLEAELTKAQPACVITLLLPMNDYIPDTPVGNALITSLVGWEFINKKITEYPKQITIKPRIKENKSAMSEFHELDESDETEFTIPTLKSHTFLGLPSLVSLNLSNLGITTVESGAFTALPHLQEINLSDNAIKMFPVTAVATIKTIKNINLYGNPLLPEECAHLKAAFGKHVDVSCTK